MSSGCRPYIRGGDLVFEGLRTAGQSPPGWRAPSGVVLTSAGGDLVVQRPPRGRSTSPRATRILRTSSSRPWGRPLPYPETLGSSAPNRKAPPEAIPVPLCCQQSRAETLLTGHAPGHSEGASLAPGSNTSNPTPGEVLGPPPARSRHRTHHGRLTSSGRSSTRALRRRAAAA